MLGRASGGAPDYHSLNRPDDDDDVFINRPSEIRPASSNRDDELEHKHALYLYFSHFLSMSNSRFYEFALIIFIQHAFPGNLLATSINGITETICVLLFSSALGRWVDRQPSRRRTLLTTIVVNRAVVVVCCSIWFLVLTSENARHKKYLFVLILGLGMIEKSSRNANILSLERDWIPTLASSRQDASYDLTYLNTMIRRIDVLCKFLAPLAISTFIAAIAPVKVAVAVVALSSLLSVGPECWCIQAVWDGNSQIKAPKDASFDASSLRSSAHQDKRDPISTAIIAIKASLHSHANSLHFFFNSPVWIPALCAAVMHGSVLTWSGTLITYLLNAGFPLGVITVGKAIGSLFEIGSTLVFPRAVRLLSSDASSSSIFQQKALPRTEAEDALLETNEELDGTGAESGDKDNTGRDVDTGVVRAGLWGISTMFPNLVYTLTNTLDSSY